MTTNRKPPDELADVRERIKELKGREDELRDLLLSGEVDLVGDDYAARISTVTQQRVDSKKIRREFGEQFLEPFMVAVEITTVNVDRMKGDE